MSQPYHYCVTSPAGYVRHTDLHEVLTCAKRQLKSGRALLWRVPVSLGVDYTVINTSGPLVAGSELLDGITLGPLNADDTASLSMLRAQLHIARRLGTPVLVTHADVLEHEEA